MNAELRSAPELIAELEAEATRRGGVVVLAVVFSSGNAIAVKADDPERLRRLDEALGLGGIPLGLIFVDHDIASNAIQYRVTVFPKFRRPEALVLMRELALGLREEIRRDWPNYPDPPRTSC